MPQDDLEDFDTQDLMDEVARRLACEAEANPPKLLDNPDFTALIEVCASPVKDAAQCIETYEQMWAFPVYEAAMHAVYGRDIMDWMRNRFPGMPNNPIGPNTMPADEPTS